MRSKQPVEWCCSDMERNLQHTCDTHSEPEDCPDALIGYFGDETDCAFTTEAALTS
jgi:hypothetical protein